MVKEHFFIDKKIYYRTAMFMNKSIKSFLLRTQKKTLPTKYLLTCKYKIPYLTIIIIYQSNYLPE